MRSVESHALRHITTIIAYLLLLGGFVANTIENTIMHSELDIRHIICHRMDGAAAWRIADTLISGARAH